MLRTGAALILQTVQAAAYLRFHYIMRCPGIQVLSCSKLGPAVQREGRRSRRGLRARALCV